MVSKSTVIYASLGKRNGAVVRRVTPQKEGPGFEPTGYGCFLGTLASSHSQKHMLFVNLIVSESLLAIDWIDIRIYPNLTLMTAAMGPSLPRN